jgi:hypothetical protein
MTSKRRLRVTVTVAVVVVLLAGAAVVVVRWLTAGPDTRLAGAVALAPADSQRLTWTDWAGVRDELGADVGASSSATDVEELLDAGFEADLTSTSALTGSATTLQTAYGVSPATLEWELLAQGPEGQVILMGLPESLDLDELRSRLTDVGYTEPDDPDGTWSAGPDALAAAGSLTPELANLRIDADERVLVGADDAGYLAAWDDDPRGTGRDDGVEDVVAAYDDEDRALSAVLSSGDQVCAELAMSQADPADQAQADALLADAGEVHPIRGFAIAAVADGTVEVALAFETADAARTDADTRATLAVGPAPGQGGSFTERFTLGDVTADDRLVTMSLEPTPGSYVLSDLSSGPVLFATC